MNPTKIINNKGIKAIVLESWAVSWPMTLIMFFEFLIGLSDVYIAGRFGKEVQAGYGLAFQLYFIFIISGMALTVGTVSVISRLFTSENRKGLFAAVNTSLVMAIAAGILSTVLGVFFSKQAINHLSTPLVVKALAVPLLIIYSMGFIFDYVLMSTNGILRACGMIRKSLLTMTVVCLLNIALNFMLAFGTALGYRGIGVATVISLSIGAVLNLIFTRRLISPGRGWLSFSVFKDIMNISWPAGLLQIFWQLGTMVLFLILGLMPFRNIEVMAAFTNGLKIESAIFLPAFAFSMANAVLVGNALGRNDAEDAFKRGIATAVTGVVIVTAMTIIIMSNAGFIASRLSGDSVVVDETLRYIYIALLLEPFMAWNVILGGGLNGAGDTKAVMLIVGLSVWCVRIPLSYLAGAHFGFGPAGVWWAMNASIICQGILITRRYFSKNWMLS